MTTNVSLGDITASDQGFCHLYHPKTRELLYHDSKPVGFMVWSPASDVMTALENAQTNRRLTMVARAGRPVAPRAEQVRADATNLLIKAVASYENLSLDGETMLVFSEEQTRALFTSPNTAWMRKQVDDFYGSEENFIV